MDIACKWIIILLEKLSYSNSMNSAYDMWLTCDLIHNAIMGESFIFKPMKMYLRTRNNQRDDAYMHESPILKDTSYFFMQYSNKSFESTQNHMLFIFSQF